jgi:hypothetical protein
MFTWVFLFSEIGFYYMVDLPNILAAEGKNIFSVPHRSIHPQFLWSTYPATEWKVCFPELISGRLEKNFLENFLLKKNILKPEKKAPGIWVIRWCENIIQSGWLP